MIRFNKRMPPLALLVGGKATRLGSITQCTPKALLTVGGEPFIAQQLRLLSRENINNVVICTGHMAPQIEEFVGNGSRFGIEVEYSFDGDTLLGTGGAVKKALPLLGESFFVMYGDSYLDISFAPIVETFRKSTKLALMTIFRNEGKWDKSNIEFENGIILNYNKRETASKMHFIDYGLSIFNSGAFDLMPNSDKFDLAELFALLVGKKGLAGFETKKRFYEIGSNVGLEETNALLRQR